MEREKHKEELRYCPVARFFSDLGKVSGRKAPFFEHLNASRIEFLKAIRLLFDEKIERLEKMSTERGKKMSKIEVE